MAEEFKNIQDVLEDVAPVYADAIRDQAISKGVFKTGRLARSYKGMSQVQGNKVSITIESEYYGPFQNYGVGTPTRAISLQVPDWIAPPPRNGKTYQFSGGNKGIKPRPFIEPAINFVNDNWLPPRLEEAGVKDIDAFIDNSIKTLGKVS